MNRFYCLALVVPFVLGTSALAADPLDHWYWRNPLPTGNFVSDVICANGQFVAVDEGGDILTSSNGVDWAVRDCGYACTLTGVAFGNGTYVAVGSTGGTPLALTSPDGVAWTAHSVGQGTSGGLLSVSFGNGTFVAGSLGADCPGIFSSPDGATWTARVTSDFVVNLGMAGIYSIAYGSGLFVAVGPADPFNPTQPMLTSADGTNWTAGAVAFTGPLLGVSFVNGAFAAVGLEELPARAGLLVSGEGTTWTNRSFSTQLRFRQWGRDFQDPAKRVRFEGPAPGQPDFSLFATCRLPICIS